MMPERDFDTVIVGAGLAGLNAARALAAGGATVVVLEARDRVGGRTFTQLVGDTPVDRGGQYIAPDQARMHRLVRELGLHTMATCHHGSKVIDFCGHRATYTRDIPSLPPHVLLQVQFFLSLLNRASKGVAPASPWSAGHAQRWDAISVEGWFRRFTVDGVSRAFLAHVIRMTFGVEPSEMSLLHLAHWVGTAGGLTHMAAVKNGGQQDYLAEGTQEIAKRVAASLNNAIVLGAPVHRILQDAHAVTVHSDRVWRARFAIVAIPPLLAGRIDYDPAMPALRDGLTQRFPMGAAIKCIALYERAFWRERGFSGEAIADGDPVGVVLGSSDLPSNQQPARLHSLVAFIEGAPARRWSARPAAERRQAVLRDLARLFGTDAQSPVEYIEQDWIAERWTGGCSAGVMPPGVLAQFGPVLRLPVGRLHWAGSETATEFYGYMEGALESGERAAREVLARL
jgi:monoamine oxidase